jgi:hypothetical protein
MLFALVFIRSITWEGANDPPPIFFLPKKLFLATELKRDKQIIWGDSGGKGCVCMYVFMHVCQDWFKPVFPLC